MKIKICGITNLLDAKEASRLGADALGFIFYKKSPRYIDPYIVGIITDNIPPFIKKVGVFVNTSAENINNIAKISKIDLAQIHFTPKENNFYNLLDVPYINVIRAKNIDDIKNIDNKFNLVDSFVKNYGGCGVSIDLSWFEDVDKSKIVLAGGINIDNIIDIKKYGFYGVDVCSGVEKRDGIKDHKLLKEFFAKALL